MSWFKNRKEEKPELNLGDFHERMRGFILDSQLPHGHGIAELLGCTYISDEVAEREEEESDKRLEKVAYLIPLVYAYAHSLAEGLVEHQKFHAEEEMDEDSQIPDEIWVQSNALFEKVGMATTLGAISQMVDMGLLQVVKKGKK